MIWIPRSVIVLLSFAVVAARSAPPEDSLWKFDQPSAGDNPGEKQAPPNGFQIPAAPVLSPEDALKTFHLPAGFRIELVASEPLVDTPVAMDFDPDGRLWVVEMRGYQNDPQGSNRLNPTGRIVVLEDTDDDGRMDRRTLYMDGLVLPRAVKVLSDGVLVAEPPYVWHTRDVDGNLRMDEKSMVCDDYGVRDSNPGHAPNGLVWGLDNWLHSGTYSARLRRVKGEWLKQPTPVLGHWGLGMDDYGRTYMSTNTAPLRVNLVSTHYLLRNPNHDGGGGIFEAMTSGEEREVYPLRPNPGVNRGYVKGTLRQDGRLFRYTAGCGTSIFRGDQLPPEVRGNHFFCEPAGNLIRRTLLAEQDDGRITGRNAHPKSEFLASTDERFRPVNTCTAPDGTLYVVDMYRGLLESHPFVTTYLKRQVYERGLLEPRDRGRIYRIAHESTRRVAKPRLSSATSRELVAVLSHPNGWWRDTAQRLLIERGDLGVVSELRKLAREASGAIPRLHALWTLEGLGALAASDIAEAARDANHHVRAAAVCWTEPWLKIGSESEVTAIALRAVRDDSALVRLQAAASLGELQDPRAIDGLVELLTRNASQPYLAEAVMHSVGGREFQILARLGELPSWSVEKSENATVFSLLAAAIFRSARPEAIEQVLEWAAKPRPVWQSVAILRSISKPTHVAKKIEIPNALTESKEESIRAAAIQLARWLRPDDTSTNRQLTKAEQDLFEIGVKNYGVYCAQCHQANGRGSAETAPSLLDSKWVGGAPDLLVKIVLYGKQGPNGTIMPPWGNVLDDRHIASILTYVRRQWGDRGSPVSIEAVRRARTDAKSIQGMWTNETLEKYATQGSQ